MLSCKKILIYLTHLSSYVHFLPILTLFGRTKVVSFTQTIKYRRLKLHKKSATLVESHSRVV